MWTILSSCFSISFRIKFIVGVRMLDHDIKYMALCIDIAKSGIGKVNPNPLVGSVLVKDEK